MCHWASNSWYFKDQISFIFSVKLLDHEDEGTMTLQNTRNYLPSDTMAHPIRPGASVTLLWEPQISKHNSYCSQNTVRMIKGWDGAGIQNKQGRQEMNIAFSWKTWKEHINWETLYVDGKILLKGILKIGCVGMDWIKLAQGRVQQQQNLVNIIKSLYWVLWKVKNLTRWLTIWGGGGGAAAHLFHISW